jgi:hypothetical protein
MEVAMLAEEVLRRYVREVTGQLPIRMRSDVGLELTTLLREEMQARAEDSDRAPDETLALAVLESYGHPREVAHRYHPRWTIIDPADTRSFILSVIVGFAVLIAMSVPTALLTPAKLADRGLILVVWIGLVTLFFGIRSWARHRWPNQHAWNPRRDPDRVNRLAMVLLIAVIGITIALFAEPQQIFAWLTGGKQLAASLSYDPAFRSLRLPWLFAVWIVQAVMLAALAVRGRWNPMLRRVSMAANVAFVVLFAWYRADGPVMADPVPNQTVKAFMAMIALLLLIDLGVRLYQGAGRISDAKQPSTAR